MPSNFSVENQQLSNTNNQTENVKNSPQKIENNEVDIVDENLELEFEENPTKLVVNSAQKFSLRHVFRAGAIVWTKHNGQDYYMVFRSITRPSRGTQLPGGRVERHENSAHAVLREVREETGVDTKIVCPLGFAYFQNQNDKYSSLAIYYILRPTFPQDVHHKWRFTDKDKTKQELECWFVNSKDDTNFLSSGQHQIADMFKLWLDEHRRPDKENETNSNTPILNKQKTPLISNQSQEQKEETENSDGNQHQQNKPADKKPVKILKIIKSLNPLNKKIYKPVSKRLKGRR